MGDIPGLNHELDGQSRCWWCGTDSDYRRYHDLEWGRPVVDDQRLFEKICLEGFQSGLSWLTILRKRENFRLAFEQFAIAKVSAYQTDDIDRLLANSGIIRHRGKIQATINNANRAIEMREEFGSLAAFFWQFEPTKKERPKAITHATVSKLGQTAQSQALSKELRKRGWKFVGPTTAYAFMQAMGIVNDHLQGCSVRDEVDAERARLIRPVASN